MITEFSELRGIQSGVTCPSLKKEMFNFSHTRKLTLVLNSALFSLDTNDRVRTSSEVQKSRVFQGCFTVFSRAFPGLSSWKSRNENNIHNEL